MKTLNFVARWSKTNKKQTWSGIVWGLYTTLGKYYKVNDIDISEVGLSTYYRVARYFARKIGLRLDDININLINNTRRYINNSNFGEGLFFQFDESIIDDSTRNTYVFIDESVDHALFMRECQPEVFEKSNFAKTNIHFLEKRRKQQNDYFMNCAGIFTLCHWLVDDLVNRTGIPADKVHYGGSGINVDFEAIDDSQKIGNKILFVGKDFERKGGYHIVDAFKKLKQKMPTAELHVAGPKENPVNEHIDGYCFHGLCNRTQLNELYNRCDVFAMPSYFEAFGIVFVEALTFGLPCLVRNCQDMPVVVKHGETGYVIDADEIEVTADYLFDLLNNPKFKNNVTNNRSYYKSYYSWESVAERIHNVIG